MTKKGVIQGVEMAKLTTDFADSKGFFSCDGCNRAER